MWPFHKKAGAAASSDTKAAQLAPEFLRLGNYFGKQFFRVILGRDVGPGDEVKQFRVAIETFFFATYLTGRLTAHLPDGLQGGGFPGQIREAACRTLFQAQPGAEKVNFTDYAGAIEVGWQSASAAYNKCPAAMPKSDSDLMEGTLFWEFSKRLIAEVEAPNADGIGSALKIAIELGDSVLVLVEAAGIVPSE
jgi:hypothetical protein